MWKCNKCGAENQDNEKLCSSCGEAYEEVAEEIEEVETETVETETVETETAETETVETETVETETAETETDNEIEFSNNWVCPNCGAECTEDVCPFCGEKKPESLNIVDFVPKKNNSKVIALVAVIIVVVLVTAGIFGYYWFNRHPKATGENGEYTYEDITSTSDSIWSDDIAMKVNGIEVPTEVFKTHLYQVAISYVEEYAFDENTYSFDEEKIKNFKWTDIADEKTGKTHREVVIENTVNSLVEMYTVLSLGEEHKISATDAELKEIDDSIPEIREFYGDDLETVIKHFGYSSIDQYKDYVKLNMNATAAVTDIQTNISKYKNEDTSVYGNLKSTNYINVKHILIMADEENGVTDADAKKTAEEVLKKAKKGEDFDKLIEEYSQDPGQTENGYTIDKDGYAMGLGGQMVSEFTQASWKLKPDQISDVVKSDFGYHIIKRNISYLDIVSYETENAEVLLNTGLIKDAKIELDYTKRKEEMDKIEAKAQERAKKSASAETAETEETVSAE